MSLFGRLAKTVAPMPPPQLHKVRFDDPVVKLDTLPIASIAAPTVYRITNSILSPSAAIAPEHYGLDCILNSGPLGTVSVSPILAGAVYRIANGVFVADIPVSSNLLYALPVSVTPSLLIPLAFTGIVTVQPKILPSEVQVPDLPPFPRTWVSGNLFERLLPSGIVGMDYSDRDKRKGADTSAPKSIDQNGFAKAYSRTKTPYGISTHAVKSLSIWDLIYPTLLPPLPVEFDPDVDIFHRLYPYQQVGVKFLVDHESALLADDMGTGKTVMTAVALRVLFQSGRATKALIVCPVSLLRVWQEHLRDWAPELSITVVRGNREERKLDWKYPAHVYIAAYDTVAADFLNVVKKKTKITCTACQRTSTFAEKVHMDDERTPTFQCPHCDTPFTELPTEESLVAENVIASFDAVVLDEAQYIKNPSTSRSRGVKRPIPRYRWALTGTPVETKVEDLAGIFSFVKPKYMHYNVTRGEAKHLMQPYFLRRMKKDVLQDLPPKMKQEQWLELDAEQQSEYDRVLRGEVTKLTELGEQVTKAHIFAVITALKRVCNFAKGKPTSPKSELLVDYIKTIKENGNKALVFTQWVDEFGVETLKSVLKPFGVSILQGGLTDAARQAAIDKFRNDSHVSVLLATLRTGGVGLTLTEANYVFHFDHWWNPASMWQAEDRVHRKGQQKGVNVYSFWTQKTIEERIHQKLVERGMLFEDVVNSLSDKDIDQAVSTDDWLDMLGVPRMKRARAE